MKYIRLIHKILILTIFFTATAHATFAPRNVKYMGRTAATNNGDLGGITGANTKCQVDYPNSHICTQAEVVASGVTSIAGDGWVLCNNVWYNNTHWVCETTSHGFYDNSATPACAGYTASSGTQGLVLGTNGVPSYGTNCGTAKTIHCCK